MKYTVKNYLIAGLLVWLPVWVTLLILRFLINLLDSTLNLLPRAYQPDQLIGMHIPGLGVLLSLLILFTTGLFVTNFLGKRLVAFGESLVSKIPLVRTIHHAIKQVLETIFSTGSDSFRRVFLVEYPRRGMWSIGFQTGVGSEEVSSKSGEDMVAIS